MSSISENKISKLKRLLEPNRIEILKLLTIEETCVCEMVKKIKIKHNLLSHHLKTLQQDGFIVSTREGQHILYQLDKSKSKTVNAILNIIFNHNENS